ncbi:hypothetical protein AAFF_G00210810 [Aldrovandia affinis]|uniref:Reverse transcriptase/retrotransposon-derived protein RNase H-like domain-containing protein n=1 Tax=Aldrovandia affinis TaxID=143900 RepID=A0AAD7WV26_9TELE|nr:hypothetical protein AAFF_G00210810 [Aldrovandia affinis]
MDDILVYGCTREEHDQWLAEVFRAIILGMINYLCRYFPNSSTVLQPLNYLLRSDVAWSWGPSQEEAFKKVKGLLTSAPVLASYNASSKKQTDLEDKVEWSSSLQWKCTDLLHSSSSQKLGKLVQGRKDFKPC